MSSPVPSLDERRPTEVELLRRRVDELARQLLGARDAALGAEAERGVALARVSELEHQVHVANVEIDELRSALDRCRSRSLAAEARSVAATGRAVGGRLARGVAKRAGGPRS